MTGNRRIPFLISVVLLLLSALSVAACGRGGSSTAAEAPPRTSSGRAATVGEANSSLGKIVVDSRSRTLYLFKAGSGSTSACTEAYANAWPPLLARGNPSAGGGANASLVATIERSGGGPQVTYNGHPLCRFADGQKPGDVNGQGVTGIRRPLVRAVPVWPPDLQPRPELRLLTLPRIKRPTGIFRKPSGPVIRRDQ